jgi:hypothetical protein
MQTVRERTYQPFEDVLGLPNPVVALHVRQRGGVRRRWAAKHVVKEVGHGVNVPARARPPQHVHVPALVQCIGTGFARRCGVSRAAGGEEKWSCETKQHSPLLQAIVLRLPVLRVAEEYIVAAFQKRTIPNLFLNYSLVHYVIM